VLNTAQACEREPRAETSLKNSTAESIKPYKVARISASNERAAQRVIDEKNSKELVRENNVNW